MHASSPSVFARSFANQGDDGVFRYEPPQDTATTTSGDDSEVDDWFDLAPDPKVAQAVAEAEAVARTPVAPEMESRPAKPGIGAASDVPAVGGGSDSSDGAAPTA